MDEYWYFLSYSRRNNLYGKYIEKFYQDFSKVLAQTTTLEVKPEEVANIGFLDKRSIEPGNEWPEELRDALQKSRVLICLYSRHYFQSQYCGKEWRAFRNRLESHVESSPVEENFPPLIIPVLWDTYELTSSLPESLVTLQYNYDELGEKYAKEGLLGLIRTNKNKEDYENFLIKFARLVAERMEKHPIKGNYKIPSLTKIQSAFHIAKKFIFDEALSINRSFLGQLRQAEENQNIVIILVDLWGIKLENLEKIIKRYDELGFINCGVLVLLNESDKETSVNRNDLEEKMFHLFKRNIQFKKTYFRYFINSKEMLNSELRIVLNEVRRIMIGEGRPLPMRDNRSIPEVSGVIQEGGLDGR